MYHQLPRDAPTVPTGMESYDHPEIHYSDRFTPGSVATIIAVSLLIVILTIGMVYLLWKGRAVGIREPSPTSLLWRGERRRGKRGSVSSSQEALVNLSGTTTASSSGDTTPVSVDEGVLRVLD